MTKYQFEYAYKKLRKFLKNKNLNPISRIEFEKFLNAIGFKEDMNVDIDVFINKLCSELEETWEEMNTQAKEELQKLVESIDLEE